MAFVTLDTDALRQNYHYLDTLFSEAGIQWSVVTKLLCGHPQYLKAVLDLGVRQVSDSRIAHLKTVKELAPDVETVFIKPPARHNLKRVLRYADISFHTDAETLQALSEAAVEMGITHKVVIMVELGELREGVQAQHLTAFYGRIAGLPNIEVIGLGTNLTCMYGVLPSYEKLRQLEDCRERLRQEFDAELPVLSGGASVTIPLIEGGELPPGINHFRVGESLFFGTDVYNNCVLKPMQQDLFRLHAEIIELRDKPSQPFGERGYNLTGEKQQCASIVKPTICSRAILDVGLLDIEPKYLTPVDAGVRIDGASSDMMVLDLGRNPQRYRVGDKLEFTLNYMGVLQLMNSRYVEKRIESCAKSLTPARAQMN